MSDNKSTQAMKSIIHETVEGFNVNNYLADSKRNGTRLNVVKAKLQRYNYSISTEVVVDDKGNIIGTMLVVCNKPNDAIDIMIGLLQVAKRTTSKEDTDTALENVVELATDEIKKRVYYQYFWPNV